MSGYDDSFDGAGQLEGEQQQAEPATLQDAFIAINESDQAKAGDAVPSGEEVESAVASLESGEAAGGEAEQPVGDDGHQDDGGHAAGSQEFDAADYTGKLDDELGRAAIQSVAQQFKQAGIHRWGVNDLYDRDERTGMVNFINPDNPQRPFTSRAEAQAWCESMNKDIENEFRKAAASERERLRKVYKPARELLEFAPKFNEMSQAKRDLLADLIDPYAVTDPKGNVIGYSCSLDKMSKQADKILGRFETKQEKAKAKPEEQGSEPALDMPSGNGASAGEKPDAPKNLEDAFRILNSKKGK